MPINDVQKTNKQHAVPQNIMDVEFKIIGDLTMRQFFYLLVFFGFAYSIFTLYNGFLKWPLILFLVCAGLAFAFLPIEERSLDQWVVNSFRAIYKDTQYVWRKTPEIPPAFSFENMSVVKQELITLTPTSSRRKLEEFLEAQTDKTVIDPLDIPEVSYIKMVRQGFKNAAPVIEVEGEVEPTFPAYDESAKNQAQSSEEPTQNVPVQEVPLQTPSTSTPAPIQPEPAKQSISTDTPKQDQPQQKPTKPPEEKKHHHPSIKLPKLPHVPRPLLPKHVDEPIEVSKGPFLAPITPDQHSGRKFTSLLPKQGEIILPIRGETVIQTTEEAEIEEDIEEKAEQLRKLLSHIRQTENIPETTRIESQIEEKSIDIKPDEKEAIQPEVQDTLEQLKRDNERLKKEIEQLKREITKPQTSTERSEKITTLKRLEHEQHEKEEAYSLIKNKLSNIQEKIFVKRQPESENISNENDVQEWSTPSNAVEPTYAKMKPLNETPNLLSGVVVDPADKRLEGIILIVKNNKDEPVRALKTNQTGQFSISTPLANGVYTVETDKSKRTNYTFDIIKIVTKGEVIPPIEIKGK